ncbi:MAG TPA: FISUMP domain-containing protein [Draconibacterium sp.]|nr:FISUMP domain-containing protein [Draconibacterium sp.]
MKNTFYFLLIAILFVACQKDEEDQFNGDSGKFTDTRDNQTYNWVRIGDQIWMAENLTYLPSVSPSNQGSGTAPYYYVYGYQGTDVAAAKQNANYTTYGVLYNWPAAKSACPPGWHLPTGDEWTALTIFLGGSSVAGGKMKEAGTAHWLSPNSGATNESEFSAFPGGYRYSDGFANIGLNGGWWSATEYDSDSAWRQGVHYYVTKVDRNPYYKQVGFSVRCVRD